MSPLPAKSRSTTRILRSYLPLNSIRGRWIMKSNVGSFKLTLKWRKDIKLNSNDVRFLTWASRFWSSMLPSSPAYSWGRLESFVLDRCEYWKENVLNIFYRVLRTCSHTYPASKVPIPSKGKLKVIKLDVFTKEKSLLQLKVTFCVITGTGIL